MQVTHSSGNHGQALAFAAKQFQTSCVVVVPSNAPKAKVSAIEGYGAKIILVEPTMEARKSKCQELSDAEGLRIVDPHDDWDVMEGQGTLAIEIVEQVPDAEAVLISVGGGGLAGGISQWFSERHPAVKGNSIFSLHKGFYLRKPDISHLEDHLPNSLNLNLQ